MSDTVTDTDERRADRTRELASLRLQAEGAAGMTEADIGRLIDLIGAGWYRGLPDLAAEAKAVVALAIQRLGGEITHGGMKFTSDGKTFKGSMK